jgi:hypothetical protein
MIKNTYSYQELLGDGSSKFINNGNFRLYQTSWIVSNESFMDNQNVFSFLKLKASFGVTGEQGVQDGNGDLVYYPGLDTYSINNLNDQASLGNFIKEILT